MHSWVVNLVKSSLIEKQQQEWLRKKKKGRGHGESTTNGKANIVRGRGTGKAEQPRTDRRHACFRWPRYETS